MFSPQINFLEEENATANWFWEKENFFNAFYFLYKLISVAKQKAKMR